MDRNGVSVLLGAPGGGFEAESRYGVGDEPISIALGDLDGDGRLDIVTANERSNDVSVLPNLGAPLAPGCASTPKSSSTRRASAR